MKKIAVFVSLFSVLLFVAIGHSAVDEAAISNNVDTIVAALESGKAVSEFKAEAYQPYAFIMEEGGKLLVHPSLTGESLKDKAPPVYQALMNATPAGIWVEYEWQGKVKHTYAKKTSSNLIVGSGY